MLLFPVCYLELTGLARFQINLRKSIQSSKFTCADSKCRIKPTTAASLNTPSKGTRHCPLRDFIAYLARIISGGEGEDTGPRKAVRRRCGWLRWSKVVWISRRLIAAISRCTNQTFPGYYCCLASHVSHIISARRRQEHGSGTPKNRRFGSALEHPCSDHNCLPYYNSKR